MPNTNNARPKFFHTERKNHHQEIILSGTSDNPSYLMQVSDFAIADGSFSLTEDDHPIVATPAHTLSMTSVYYPKGGETHYFVDNTSNVTLDLLVTHVVTPTGASGFEIITETFAVAPTTQEELVGGHDIFGESNIYFTNVTTPDASYTIGFLVVLI